MVKNKYKLIDSQSALNELATLLSGEKTIGVDTESNSMYAYREEVCLIQISTPKDNFIIDPFELDDLSPLGPDFASAKVEKIFHAGEYDVLCLSRDYGFDFNNLFDTMTAAKILNVEKIGLGDIIENEFNIKVPKKYQKADWGRRPLSEEMLEYAMMDTKFLIPLRNQYKKE
ncbi:MAG: ribonuclease D [Elusimicrobia bacterium]|jgi:ribonuclease D|nr:ribonuclease D [Elusimicrobiota bacterium]